MQKFSVFLFHSFAFRLIIVTENKCSNVQKFSEVKKCYLEINIYRS